jgi:PilZ domain
MIENRRNYRIPFREKFVFSTSMGVYAGNGVNVSKGGAFVSLLETPQIKTGLKCRALFKLTPTSKPISIDATVKRVIASNTNPETVPGLAFEFENIDPAVQSVINNYLEESRKNFEVIATILASGEPDLLTLEPLLATVQLPPSADLGELRFHVERILRAIEMVEKDS